MVRTRLAAAQAVRAVQELPMRPLLSLACLLVFAPAALAGDSQPAEAVRDEGRILILDTASVSFQSSKKSDVKKLSDVDREAAEAIMAINATRGTWQSYLLYTTPEMKVPTSRPGFIITLPPPSRKELERRRQRMAAAEKAAAERAPEPARER